MRDEHGNTKRERQLRMNACESPITLFYRCPVCGLKYKKTDGEGICPNCKGQKE